MIANYNTRLSITIPTPLNDYLDAVIKAYREKGLTGYTKSVIITIALNKLLKEVATTTEKEKENEK